MEISPPVRADYALSAIGYLSHEISDSIDRLFSREALPKALVLGITLDQYPLITRVPQRDRHRALKWAAEFHRVAYKDYWVKTPKNDTANIQAAYHVLQIPRRYICKYLLVSKNGFANAVYREGKRVKAWKDRSDIEKRQAVAWAAMEIPTWVWDEIYNDTL